MSDAPQIRRAEPSDLAGLMALEAQFPGDRISRSAMRRLLRSPSAHVLVADAGGSIAGALILLTRRNARRGRIYSLAVDAAQRRQGLASRLLAAAHALARELGCPGITLEVRKDNDAARAFYARHGYRVLRELPGYYEDGGDGLRMGRELSD